MDRQTLAGWVEEGCSLEEMARRVARHPSTVSYWLEKHGLTAPGSLRHRARGGLDRVLLAGLVADDLTVAEIAASVDRSPTTVRYWLAFHGLETRRSARLRAGGRPAPDAPPTEQIACAIHGPTPHALRDGRYRCRKCGSDSVTRYRQKVKRTLVAEAGGACAICGYAACLAALHFHHVDPATKRFGLGLAGIARSIETVRAEAEKCVLLCANCHAEVEAGISILPGAARLDRG